MDQAVKTSPPSFRVLQDLGTSVLGPRTPASGRLGMAVLHSQPRGPREAVF